MKQGWWMLVPALAVAENPTYATSSANANECSVGRFHNAWANKCLDCPSGKFQRLEHAHECEGCPSGKYQLTAGQNSCATNTCAGGSIPSWSHLCVKCSPGQFAAAGEARCSPCDMLAGAYAFSAGQAACTQSRCEAGWRQTQSGCIKCSENQYQPKAGMPNCINCPPAWQLLTAQGAHRYHTGGMFNPTYAARGATACSTERPGAPARCAHMTCQFNGNHLRVSHERAEAHGTRHHCFWRATSTAGGAYNHCCRGLTPSACFHQKQADAHCDTNGATASGECLCVCFSPLDTAV
jgi:hypothetical protein